MIYSLLLRPLVAILAAPVQIVTAVLNWSPFSHTRLLYNYEGRPHAKHQNVPLLAWARRRYIGTLQVLIETLFNLSLVAVSHTISIVSWCALHSILLLSLTLLVPYNVVKFLLHELLAWPIKVYKVLVMCLLTLKKRCVCFVKNINSLCKNNWPTWQPSTQYQFSYWIGQSKIYKSCLLLFLVTYMYLLSCESRNYSTSIITSFVFVMPVYLLWQTFTYFFKTYHISKYTTQVAAFWQRTYLVFWSLEISLYLIFIFIWFISPEAPKMVIGQTLNLKAVNASLVAVINIFTSLLLLLTLNLFLLLKKNYQNQILVAPVLLVTLYLYTSILVDEYKYFLYNSAQWSAMVETFTYEGVLSKSGTKVYLGSVKEQVLLLLDNYNVNKLEKSNEELVAQMTYSLLWFLRFWHVVLIFLMFSFFTLKWITGHAISFEALSMNVYNVIILIAFNLTYLVFFIKTIGKEYLTIVPRAYSLDDIANVSYQIMLEAGNVVGL